MDQSKNNNLSSSLNNPILKLVLVILAILIIFLLVVSIYSNKYGKSVTKEATGIESSTLSKTKTIEQETTTSSIPADKGSTAKSQTAASKATPIVISSDTSVKTIVNELKSLNLDDLSSSVKDLQKAVGQFKN
ncbi:MAG: hypothetical protein WAP74_03100 [Patescibacteria group bacterium]